MNLRQIVPALLLVVLIGLSFVLVKPFLLAIFLGALFAYVMTPLFSVIQKKLTNKSLAAFLVTLLVFLIIILPSVFFIKTLVQESYSLYTMVQYRLDHGGFFAGCTYDLCVSLRAFFSNPNFNLQLEQVIGSVTSWIIQKGSRFLLGVPKILMNLFIMLFTLFYFLRDGDKFLSQMQVYLCLPARNYKKIISRLKDILHGVVYGYLIVAGIQGALGALGFFLFGVPSPVFWGMLMGFLALIPYLGTGVVWIPAVLLMVITGIIDDSRILLLKGIGLAIDSFIFVSSLDNIIRPFFIGDKAKVHPVVILLGIFGGIFFVGPLGVILGPIIFSLTIVGLETALDQRHVVHKK